MFLLHFSLRIRRNPRNNVLVLKAKLLNALGVLMFFPADPSNEWSKKPAAKKAKKATADNADSASDSESRKPPTAQGGGRLQPIAASVLMKVLYGARMARYDLLRPTCRLACHVANWTEDCDRRLHRLMCYIQSSLTHRLVG